MKKYSFCFLGILTAVSILSSISVCAENEPAKQITFRDIPWYSTKTEAEKILADGGATAEDGIWENYAYRMSGIDWIRSMGRNDFVDGGGFHGTYSGVNVAGYDVSDTYACYIFTIDEQGNINKTVDDAQFYFGWYTFDSNDFADGEEIYNDLSEKLTSLYGEGVSDTENKYHSTVTWHDDENNQIRLLLGNKNTEGAYERYVTLGYMAADAEDRLDEIEAILNEEDIASEAEDREANQDNVSGL